LEEKKANVRRLWGYVDVRDVAQAYRLALETEKLEHEAFFISAENTFTKTSSLELIRRHYPKVRKISNEYLKEEHKALFDITKAKKILGFQPEFNYEAFVKL
jgi:nucleoside-diphosphate-sugar epimerase